MDCLEGAGDVAGYVGRGVEWGWGWRGGESSGVADGWGGAGEREFWEFWECSGCF